MPRRLGRWDLSEGAALGRLPLGGRVLSSHSGSDVLGSTCTGTGSTSCSKGKSPASGEICLPVVVSPYVCCGLDVYC